MQPDEETHNTFMRQTCAKLCKHWLEVADGVGVPAMELVALTARVLSCGNAML